MSLLLSDFEIIRPKFEMNQIDSLDFLARAHAKSAVISGESELSLERLQKLFSRFGVKPEQIDSRGLESQEMSSEVHSILTRTQFFGQTTNQIFEKFYPLSTKAPDHLVHVTCTGYVSPSPAQHLVSQRGWDTKITHAYHMGCYASIPAIRIAQGLQLAGDQRIDIVHTEMCSIHLNPSIHSPEQMVVQSLFADGYIRYQAGSSATESPALKILSILEKILPESEADMTWITADSGMHMTLSREVPEKISLQIESFLQSLCKQAGMDYETMRKEAIFAIHPGGPKIIDSVESKLKLEPWQCEASKNILFHYGNMSSATLPHVWKKILTTATPKQKVLSLAFGPGLTIFGALFEVLEGK